MFCMFPDSKSEWKKGATGQSFIRKEITSYRIGTLTESIKMEPNNYHCQKIQFQFFADQNWWFGICDNKFYDDFGQQNGRHLRKEIKIKWLPKR